MCMLHVTLLFETRSPEVTLKEISAEVEVLKVCDLKLFFRMVWHIFVSYTPSLVALYPVGVHDGGLFS